MRERKQMIKIKGIFLSIAIPPSKQEDSVPYLNLNIYILLQQWCNEKKNYLM
jgi:hypothetical protein